MSLRYRPDIKLSETDAALLTWTRFNIALLGLLFWPRAVSTTVVGANAVTCPVL